MNIVLDQIDKLVLYSQGKIEYEDLSPTLRNKYERLRRCDALHGEGFSDSQIIDHLCTQFGISERTAEKDLLDFPSLFGIPKNIKILVLKRSLQRLDAIYEKYGALEDLEKSLNGQRAVLKDQIALLKILPKEEEEVEEYQLPDIVYSADPTLLGIAPVDPLILEAKRKVWEARIAPKTYQLNENTTDSEEIDF